MQAENTITDSQPLMTPFARLRAGDQVFVYDGVKEQNIWQEIADIKEVDGRWKLRVVGTDFYFDEALVVSFAFLRDDETENAESFPFFVDVRRSAYGSIGILKPLQFCERCGARSHSFFNIGTSLYTFFICYLCRFPERRVAA